MTFFLTLIVLILFISFFSMGTFLFNKEITKTCNKLNDKDNPCQCSLLDKLKCANTSEKSY